jgi:hypothetical protein
VSRLTVPGPENTQNVARILRIKPEGAARDVLAAPRSCTSIKEGQHVRRGDDDLPAMSLEELSLEELLFVYEQVSQRLVALLTAQQVQLDPRLAVVRRALDGASADVDGSGSISASRRSVAGAPVRKPAGRT